MKLLLPPIATKIGDGKNPAETAMHSNRPKPARQAQNNTPAARTAEIIQAVIQMEFMVQFFGERGAVRERPTAARWAGR